MRGGAVTKGIPLQVKGRLVPPHQGAPRGHGSLSPTQAHAGSHLPRGPWHKEALLVSGQK